VSGGLSSIVNFLLSCQAKSKLLQGFKAPQHYGPTWLLVSDAYDETVTWLNI